MASAIRFLQGLQAPSPIAVLPLVNYSSPIYNYNLYHPVPNLNNYSIEKESKLQTLHYTTDRNPQIYIPSGNLRVYRDQDNSNSNSISPPRRLDSFQSYTTSTTTTTSSPVSLVKREGWGGPGYGGGKSPAISALALLGFLFFLNLIQNNRLFLAANAVALTTRAPLLASQTGVMQGRDGRVRQKRGLDIKRNRLAPGSILDIPNRQAQLQDRFGSVPEKLPKNRGLPFWRNVASGSGPHKQEKGLKMLKERRNPRDRPRGSLLQQLKRISLGCLQLVACNVGRTLHSEVGPTASFMMNYLGKTLLPGSPRKSWTGRMFNALSYGWKSRYKCDKIFRRCLVGRILLAGSGNKPRKPARGVQGNLH